MQLCSGEALADRLHVAGSTADFIISFIAIIPLASLLGDATEQCSIKLGQTLGGASLCARLEWVFWLLTALS